MKRTDLEIIATKKKVDVFFLISIRMMFVDHEHPWIAWVSLPFKRLAKKKHGL